MSNTLGNTHAEGFRDAKSGLLPQSSHPKYRGGYEAAKHRTATPICRGVSPHARKRISYQ